MGRAERLAGLVRDFELHGGGVADHFLEEWARRWMIDVHSVERELRGYLQRREANWVMTARPAAEHLDVLAQAPDGLAAYELLGRIGTAPPTFRLFRRIFLESGAFPELSKLIKRDRLVWGLARIGQGPRACAACAGEVGGDVT